MTDIMMYQDEGEFRQFVALLKSQFAPPIRILEVGSLYGGTLITFMANFPGSKVVSVDLGIGQHDHRREGVQAAQAAWPEHAAAYACDLHAITGDSHQPDIIARAAALGPFDLCFIDGDHTYDGVWQDAKAYGEMVRPGGVVAFHDISAGYGPPHFIEVARFWDEYKIDFRQVYEIISRPRAWGIGVVIK